MYMRSKAGAAARESLWRDRPGGLALPALHIYVSRTGLPQKPKNVVSALLVASRAELWCAVHLACARAQAVHFRHVRCEF